LEVGSKLEIESHYRLRVFADILTANFNTAFQYDS